MRLEAETVHLAIENFRLDIKIARSDIETVCFDIDAPSLFQRRFFNIEEAVFDG